VNLGRARFPQRAAVRRVRRTRPTHSRISLDTKILRAQSQNREVRSTALSMKTKTIIGISVVIILCSVSFWLGRLSGSHGVITYSVGGIPTSFNRAWPTYGLPLVNYESILIMLQNRHSKEAIPHLEAFLDAAVYDAKCRHPLLQSEDLKDIDKGLAKVARYREQFPRPITNSTNKLDQFWIARQKEIDAFLHGFAKQ